MSDIDAIREDLRLQEIQLDGDVVPDAEGLRRYFAPVSVTRNRNNRQTPSNRRLIDIKTRFREQGIFVTFILRDAVAQDLETGLRATLLHSHTDHIRNVFLSVDGEVAHVWFEPKRDLSQAQYANIAKRSEDFLRLSDLTIASLSSMSDASLPTHLACMGAIRVLAPASLVAITAYLSQKGFTIPSEHWLTRRLDAVRRGSKVVRLGSGLYTLSAQGLQVLGTTKTRSSPDITRMLALAKRYG